MSDVVTEEGVYDGIPDTVYHSDKNSLSSSGARALLKSPAKFRHQQDHGSETNDAFDFGHAAHTLVLGIGAPIAVIPDDVLASNGATSTKAAKEFIANARTEGNVPLKAEDAARVHQMAEAIRSHPLASILFTGGTPEQSLYWKDETTGVWLRARPDQLPDPGRGRLIITDYKTAVSADPGKFAKSCLDYGYHQQHPWYVDAVIELGLHDDPAFIFVVQEKTAPYLVSICQLDEDAVTLGRQLNRQAIDLFAECRATDTWPGYGDDIHQIALPPYAFN